MKTLDRIVLYATIAVGVLILFLHPTDNFANPVGSRWWTDSFVVNGPPILLLLAGITYLLIRWQR